MDPAEKKTLLWVFFTCVILICATAILINASRVCTLNLKVVEITAMEFRSVIVKTEDGQVRRVHQSTFKVGDNVCFDEKTSFKNIF